ncbi:MAG: hypothetical protein IPM55_11450 [Acidobacteria bacterium]|nr:hypothetical protein [Acidobacteriota bacterium]
MQKFSSPVMGSARLAVRMALVMFVMFSLTGSFISADAQTTKKKRSTTTKKSTVRRATVIPRGTDMRIRLDDEIDTRDSKDGDTFTAVVMNPDKYANATVEGHISRIDKSGKLKGQTELVLTFDRIRLSNGENLNFAAQVVEIYGEDAGKVDEEGNVTSGSKGKETAVATGGGAALGAVIGAIAGGGKGAAIGAAVGAAAGAGGSYIRGSKKVKLEAGTELLIRTTR